MVESIDNASGMFLIIVSVTGIQLLIRWVDADLERLGMWTPIHDLIASSSSDAIKTQAVWVAGTAVQNNPKAQHAVRLSYAILPRANHTDAPFE